MNPRWVDRRGLLGAVIGSAVTLVSAWIADSARFGLLPLAVLPVLAIGITGLLLGFNAALWTYVSAAAVMIAAALRVTGDWSLADAVRLAAYLLGSPVIVYLVNRAERLRAGAEAALDESREAGRVAEQEGERLELARREVDAAYGAAERERVRLEEVAEAIPEPLIVYDDDGYGRYGNRAAMRLFGRSFVERGIDEWGRATEPRDERGAPLGREAWPQVRAQREAFRQRLVLRIPMSGRDVIVDIEGTPIPGGGAVLLLRDVGKEEDERRRLSRFASFVAHELRNPMAVGKARIELAQRDPALGPRAAGHLARALESVDAAIGILERLELYSRAEAGRIEADREAFELGPALSAAIERLRARGSDRPVRVDGVDGVAVLGDRHLSEQAITNLLTNADRYSRPNKAIHVEVTDGDVVTLRVRDEGPGIGDDVGDTLFHERVSGGRGLGLGLYLVRATMDAMGGSVQLEQRAPQAIFALRWEKAPASTADADVQPSPQPPAAV